MEFCELMAKANQKLAPGITAEIIYDSLAEFYSTTDDNLLKQRIVQDGSSHRHCIRERERVDEEESPIQQVRATTLLALVAHLERVAGQRKMKSYTQMTEAEKWDHGLRQRPLTMVMMMAAIYHPAGSTIYVAVFIDDPKIRKIAWASLTGVTLFLLGALLVVWKLEERGAISDGAKRIARGLMYWTGLVFAVASVLGILLAGCAFGAAGQSRSRSVWRAFWLVLP